MTRDYDFASGKIKTSIAFVLEWVSDENAASGSWGKFVGTCGIKVWKAEATKHAKMVITWMNSGEEEIWRV